jgi:pre-mRNA-splicing factor ATP-dependent RNA helicase DHX16
MPGDEDIQALRAARRAAFQKERAEETLRVAKALGLEDKRNAARGVFNTADTERERQRLDAQAATLAITEQLNAVAHSRERELGGDPALAGLPPGASAEAIAMARERYAARNSRPGDSDMTDAQRRLKQPSAEESAQRAAKSIFEQGLQAVGDTTLPTREMNLLVDETAVAQKIAAHDFEGEKGVSEIRQERAALVAAKRQLLDLQRANLPVARAKDEILRAVKANQVVVIIGETGSGKTTQIPQFLLEAGYKKVACTQPRRLAAMSVAERVAVEMNARCGGLVGYNVRFDNKTSERTEIEFLTDGMMLKTIMSEPTLGSFGAIMIDEAHERSLATDILLGLLRDLIRTRQDLRVVVASATIEADKFAKFFGGAPLVKVSGRTFPVSTKYLPEPEEDYVAAAAIAALQTHLDEPLPGDILVFLPGQEDIERCIDIINESIQSMEQGSVRPLVVLPVFSTLPPEEQKRIYAPPPANTRKIVVATNIAETSITIDGIVFVIDTGLSKQKHFSSRSNMESLAVVPISIASAEQRKGRAGRTQPGQCLRLYTKYMYENELDREPVPEILRTNLTDVVLRLKTLGIDNPLSFDFIDAPSPDAMCKSLDNLLVLGALNRRGQLTKTGRRMAELPVEPPLAKALLRSQDGFGCAKQMCIAAAMLSLQNSLFAVAKDKKAVVEGIKRQHFANTTGDVVGYVNLFREWEERQVYAQGWCTANGVNYNALKRAKDVRNQLLNTISSLFPEDPTDMKDPVALVDALTKSLLAGYFTNIAKLTLDDKSFLVPKTHVEAYIFPGSVLAPLMYVDRKKFEEQQRKVAAGIQVPAGEAVAKYVNVEHGQKPQLVMFTELRRLKERAYMVHVSAINPLWVQEAAPDFFRPADLSNTLSGKVVPAREKAA